MEATSATPGNGVQLVADEPVLKGPELLQVIPLPLDGIPEHMAHAGAVRAEGRRHTGGKERRGVVEPLQHPGPRPVDIRLVVEDHVDHREAEGGGGAHGLHHGQSLQVDRQGVGHLVLHHLWGTAGIVGKDDHLVVGQVRDGVHGRIVDRPDPPADDEGEDHQDDDPVSGGVFDDFFDHVKTSARLAAGAAACSHLHIISYSVRRSSSDGARPCHPAHGRSCPAEPAPARPFHPSSCRASLHARAAFQLRLGVDEIAAGRGNLVSPEKSGKDLDVVADPGARLSRPAARISPGFTSTQTTCRSARVHDRRHGNRKGLSQRDLDRGIDEHVGLQLQPGLGSLHPDLDRARFRVEERVDECHPAAECLAGIGLGDECPHFCPTFMIGKSFS